MERERKEKGREENRSEQKRSEQKRKEEKRGRQSMAGILGNGRCHWACSQAAVKGVMTAGVEAQGLS